MIAIVGFAAYPMLSSFREVMLEKGAVEQTTAAIRRARPLVLIRKSFIVCVDYAADPSGGTACR